MPARYLIKQYTPNGYYHLFNRGVEKRVIFQDEQDYAVFLNYLKEYLLPKNIADLTKQLSNPKECWAKKDKILKLLRLNNFNKEIFLLAYCLMPNHFHFFIKQKNSNSIDKFMQSLCTRYTMYFNKKYKRVGSLFQGTYKAVLVATEPQFLHLSRYVHQQALNLQGVTLQNCNFKSQPCSYLEYLGKRKTEWIKPEEILNFFSKTNPSLTYQSFVSDNNEESDLLIKEIIIED